MLALLLLQAFAPTTYLPRLDPSATLTLDASWSPCARSSYGLFEAHPFLRAPKPAAEHRVYEGAAFGPLLPTQAVAVGDTWPVPIEAVLPFLLQFHGEARSELRISDNEGAFACLRAASASHLELLLRAHAEFRIDDRTYFTPAQFEGRLLIDRRANRPLAFRLALPDRNTNVDINLKSDPQPGVDAFWQADIGWVPHMELASTVQPAPTWQTVIDDSDARYRLAALFYPLARLEWLPFDIALERAKQQGKPLLVVVLFGTLDDESC
jgi:hypothetical protein